MALKHGFVYCAVIGLSLSQAEWIVARHGACMAGDGAFFQYLGRMPGFVALLRVMFGMWAILRPRWPGYVLKWSAGLYLVWWASGCGASRPRR